MASPGLLGSPLDPIYLGSDWSQPFAIYDLVDGAQVDADLTDVAFSLVLARRGVFAAAFELTLDSGLALTAPNVLVAEVAHGQLASWPPGYYDFELQQTSEGALTSLVVGSVGLIAGPISRYPGGAYTAGFAGPDGQRFSRFDHRNRAAVARRWCRSSGPNPACRWTLAMWATTTRLPA